MHNSLATVTVYYRWHPLSGLALPVRRRQKNCSAEQLLCQSPDGRTLAIPSWICSPECLQFSLGSPLISVEALAELRTVLHVWHTAFDCLTSKEEIDETARRATQPTDESTAAGRDRFRRSIRPPARRTLALMELVISGAQECRETSVKRGDHESAETHA
jgi:hypothetical protein